MNPTPDLPKILKLLEKSFPLVETARGEEVVLVIGNTGSGKSTLINYLLGCKIEKTKNFELTIKDEKAEVGHDMDSCTLYPRVYKEPTSGIAYCDCPGFNDTRALEEIITVKLSTEAAVRAATRVRATLLVIDITEILNSRGRGFKEMSQIVASIFSQPLSFGDSLIFVLTHLGLYTPTQVEEIIPGKLANFVSLCKKQMGGLNENNEKHSILKANIRIGQMMLDHSDKIIGVNVLDGRSRVRIESLVKQCIPLPIEAFKFTANDNQVISFTNYLFRQVNNASRILKINLYLPELINELQSEIKEEEQRIEYFNNMIKNLKGQVRQFSEKEIRLLNDFGTKNEALLLSLLEKKKILEGKIRKEQATLLELDTDTLCLISKQIVERNYSLFASEKKIKYDGIPFIKVDKTNEGGFFKNEVCEPEKGHYQVTYDFDTGISKGFFRRFASVSVFIATRNKPDNVHLIEAARLELGQVLPQIEALQSRVDEVQGLLDHLQKHLKDMKGSISQTQIDTLIVDYTKKISKLELLIKQKKERIAKESVKNENFQKMTAKELEWIKPLKCMVDIFPLQSQLFNRFILLFDQFMKKESMELPTKLGITVPEEFNCPITHEIMKCPALTDCGHAFELVAISDFVKYHLDKGTKALCPVCRAPIPQMVFKSDLKFTSQLNVWKDAIALLLVSRVSQGQLTENNYQNVQNRITEDIRYYEMRLRQLETLQKALYDCVNDLDSPRGENNPRRRQINRSISQPQNPSPVPHSTRPSLPGARARPHPISQEGRSSQKSSSVKEILPEEPERSEIDLEKRFAHLFT